MQKLCHLFGDPEEPPSPGVYKHQTFARNLRGHKIDPRTRESENRPPGPRDGRPQNNDSLFYMASKH